MTIFLIFLSVFFASCTKGDPWRETSIPNSNQNYDLAKLSYSAHSLHRGINLELIRQGHQIESYFYVTEFQFPPSQFDPEKTEIHFTTKIHTYSLSLNRLKGGQRLHLSCECQDLLLDLLHTQDEFTVQIGHFSETFNTAKFKRHYQKFLKLPPRLKPENFINFELY